MTRPKMYIEKLTTKHANFDGVLKNGCFASRLVAKRRYDYNDVPAKVRLDVQKITRDCMELSRMRRVIILRGRATTVVVVISNNNQCLVEILFSLLKHSGEDGVRAKRYGHWTRRVQKPRVLNQECESIVLHGD